MVKCANCGHEIDETLNFCPHCGRAIQKRTDPAVEHMVQDALGRLTDHPDDSAARYNLALGYKLLGLKELALREFTRVAEEQPDFADVHYEIGAIRAEDGLDQEAMSELEKALALDPEHRKARRLLDRLQQDMRF